jgi:hypothetical protein
MNKIIISTILVFTLLNGITSCGQKSDTEENRLIGIWQSTKIDTLFQFITPIKPDTLITYDCEDYIFEINNDNSFKMINSTDTIIGNWNQSASDTLTLTINDREGNFLYLQNLEIEKITLNELILINFGGYISGVLNPGHSELTITEEINYKIGMYYDRIK